MGESAAGHLPVMVDEVLGLFGPALQPSGATSSNATLGRAGHARALLEAHPGLVLIGVDTDTQALEESRRLLAPYADRVTLVHAVYDEIPELLSRRGDLRVQGILFDLGVARRSWMIQPGASPIPMTPRSTCGWTRPGR